jgi:Protein of unknown function (DUF1569)
MAALNIFQQEVADGIIARINQLNDSTPAQWGKMNVSQMLAHCSVTYEMIYDNNHSAPNFLLKFILKTFVKGKLVDATTPYQKNSGTAPAFIIKDEKNFDIEKKRLVDFIEKTQQLGEAHFDGKASLSFGNLTKTEWSNLFYKHLDHHLTQFGV